jgi:hypothetical protein
MSTCRHFRPQTRVCALFALAGAPARFLQPSHTSMQRVYSIAGRAEAPNLTPDQNPADQGVLRLAPRPRGSRAFLEPRRGPDAGPRPRAWRHRPAISGVDIPGERDRLGRGDGVRHEPPRPTRRPRLMTPTESIDFGGACSRSSDPSWKMAPTVWLPLHDQGQTGQ